jgi:hypothetical protein
MRGQRHHRFTVQTARGSASYHSRLAATSAAEWVADGSGETVLIADDTTGETWRVYQTLKARVRA